MPSVEERIDALRSEVADIEKAKLRAEVEREAFEEALGKAKTVLKDDFGVETEEQMKAKLVELEQERDRLLTEAEAALKETR